MNEVTFFQTSQLRQPIAGWSGAVGGLFYPNSWAAELLGEVVPGATLVYLFCRFGYPIYGWDGDKKVVEYILTTPDPEVALTILIKATLVDFGYLLSRDAGRACSHERWERHVDIRNAPPPGTRMREVWLALRATIADLLRPVPVRDVLLDIRGRADDAELEYVEPSGMAGYGLGSVAYAYEDTDAWFELLARIGELGDGDFVVGVRRVLGKLG